MEVKTKREEKDDETRHTSCGIHGGLALCRRWHGDNRLVGDCGTVEVFARVEIRAKLNREEQV